MVDLSLVKIKLRWQLGKMVRSIRRGISYGIARPAWWPRAYPWVLGPSWAHDGKQVAIVLRGTHYEFKPVALGRYRGHVYQGKLRPDTSAIAAMLSNLSLPTHDAKIFAVVSTLEGGFDSLQTYDVGKISWGFMQFAAIGGLPALLRNIKALHPLLFHQYFESFGIDIDAEGFVVSTQGQVFRGTNALNQLHDNPALWKPFLLAAQDKVIQEVQVKCAYENYYVRIFDHSVTLGEKVGGNGGGKVYRLGDLLVDNQFGRALLFDRAVNRGLGFMGKLIWRAVKESQAQSPADVHKIIDKIKELEVDFHARVDTLEQAFRHESA